MEYWYKQKCDDCLTCESCNGVGYTESNTWDKEDIPDNAYYIVVVNNNGEIIEEIKNDSVDFLETETDVYEFGQTVSNEDWGRGVGTSRVKKEEKK